MQSVAGFCFDGINHILYNHKRHCCHDLKHIFSHFGSSSSVWPFGDSPRLPKEVCFQPSFGIVVIFPTALFIEHLVKPTVLPHRWWSPVSQNIASCMCFVHTKCIWQTHLPQNVFGRPIYPGESAGLHQGDQTSHGARKKPACCAGKQTASHRQGKTGVSEVLATCNQHASPWVCSFYKTVLLPTCAMSLCNIIIFKTGICQGFLLRWKIWS